MPKNDSVVTEVVRLLLLLGFKQVGKKYVKVLDETSAELEIQNHSMGKSQHFLNLTIVFHPEVALREQLVDGFATYIRVESIDLSEKLLNLVALDAQSDMLSPDRNCRLSKMLIVDLPKFLNVWNTVESAEATYRAAAKKHAPINFELVKRWGGN